MDRRRSVNIILAGDISLTTIPGSEDIPGVPSGFFGHKLVLLGNGD